MPRRAEDDGREGGDGGLLTCSMSVCASDCVIHYVALSVPLKVKVRVYLVRVFAWLC